jgi:aminopeptidase N
MRWAKTTRGVAGDGRPLLTALRLALLLLLAGAATQAAAARFDFETTPGRLPKDVVPSSYGLTFDVDPAADGFSGRARIEIEVRRPLSSITINALNLQPLAARLQEPDGGERVLAVTDEAARGQWRLGWTGEAPLAAGRYTLHIEYRGRIERTGQGLFRVDYTVEGKPARMLATQLQPTQARRLFPGFDEPSFRAAFEIEAVVDARLQAVSNMPVVAETPLAGGRKTVRFARTPSMPTYLVALAVGDFDALEDRHGEVPLRILTARGRGHEARYAMEVTKQVLGWFAEYFGRPYMLPKLDQIAVPGVRGGAMEDWGAISYNENLLLFDERRSPPRQRETISYLVAHEIAHQWFGNLVTAAWWDHIWLNEAFATWVADKAVNELNPVWKAALRKRLYLEEALARDAGAATRAMDAPPASETGIFEVFDEITYQKGGAVLGMFEAYLGAGVFRDGLRRYLQAHAYSNATADDLWLHLSRAAGQDLTPMIGRWTAQPGVPLIVARTTCRGGRTVVDLEQQRLAGHGTRPDFGARWPVPLRVSAGTTSEQVVLWREPAQLSFAGCVAVVANADDLGYYRVQYDRGNLARLRAAFAGLPAAERSGLIADTFALVRAGRVPLAEYRALLALMPREPEGAIWQQVIGHLEYLDEAFAGTAAQRPLRTQARALLAPKLAQLGWRSLAGEPAGTLRLRDALIDALGRFDDTAVIAQARRLYSGEAEGTPIEPSIRDGVVRTVARHADDATFENLRAKLKGAGNQEDSYLYGGALIGVRKPVLVARLLALTLGDEWPPGSAAWYAREVGSASGQTRLAQEFVVRNFAALAARASAWSRAWLLPRAFAGYNRGERADALLVAQRRLLGDDAMGPAEQVAAAIREKAGLRAREAARFAAVQTKGRPPTSPRRPS